MSETKAMKKKVPAVAGFDRNPRDFFRGSHGFTKSNFGPGPGQMKRDFTGFKRGSR
jgi:hypothetical protein